MVTKLTPEPTIVSDELRQQLAPFSSAPSQGKSFQNPWDHPALPGLSGVLRWKTSKNPLRASGYRAVPLTLPAAPLADFEALGPAPTRLFWIGHASFLFELDGVRMVVDPIFGRAGGVVPRVTPPAALPEQLGGLRVVLVTHGHHDHMDGSALRALAQTNPEGSVFVVPRGLASSLPRECRQVVELDWWQHVIVDDVKIHFVPSQHWHQRGMFDLNRGLWGGYVVEGSHRIYHSGDTGYFGGFRAIGRVFGGVDAACLPLGAYEPKWFMGSQHMDPAESLAAYGDLQATHFVGMHWGAYDLSNEPIDAGARWLETAVQERQLTRERVHVLQPGGSLALLGARGSTRARVCHRWQAG